MKFKITMKDPDGVFESIREAAKNSTANTAGLSDDELDALAEKRQEQLTEAVEPWIQYSEYLTVEIDTEAHTATVLKH